MVICQTKSRPLHLKASIFSGLTNTERSMRLFLLSLLLMMSSLNLNAQEAETGASVADQVKLIPSEDRMILLRFFKRLFYHGDFSYTLLGQKPMGSIDYNLNLLAFPQFYKEPQKHLYLMASKVHPIVKTVFS